MCFVTSVELPNLNAYRVMGEILVRGREEKAVLRASNSNRLNQILFAATLSAVHACSLSLPLSLSLSLCANTVYASGVSMQSKMSIGSKGDVAQFFGHQKVPLAIVTLATYCT